MNNDPSGPIPIAIFASGSGTNAENIIRFFSNSDICRVRLVLTNNPMAGAIQRAEKLGVPVQVISNKEAATGLRMISIMEEFEIQLIVLAGYLKLIPEGLVDLFSNKIINIHPSLLPKYGGQGMYGEMIHKKVLFNGERETGITIHYVNKNYDEGEIIFQENLDIEQGWNLGKLENQIHQLEYKHYPKIIERLCRQLQMQKTK